MQRTVLKICPHHIKQDTSKKTADNKYEVTPEIKNQITFKTFNLMEPIAAKNKYNVIFCRNVMIYFNAITKVNLVNKFYEAIQPGGHLMIGHADSSTNRGYIRHPNKAPKQKIASIFAKLVGYALYAYRYMI